MVYKNKLHKAIKVASVTITTVTVKCERCKAVATGTCDYPNHASFVRNELKYVTINCNRTLTNYPKEVIVCPSCFQDFQDSFLYGGNK